MVLCHALIVMFEKGTAALKATAHGAAFDSVTRVFLEVEDIEDEVFWMSIFCLLRAVFSALKAF